MTGWGQSSPYANAAGSDINYIALAGALGAELGHAGEQPTPPPQPGGRLGMAALLVAFGICAALVEAASSGQGQVNGTRP